MIALFNRGQFGTLVVEAVDCGFLACLQNDLAAMALCCFIFDEAQGGQRSRRCRADKASAFAMRTFAGGGFEHAGTQTLTAHFHQAKAGNTADLNTGTVVLQRFLHRALDFAGVRMMLHVDEVDHDQASHVAQAQLTGNLACSFQIGRKRGLLNAMFFGRTA